MKFWFLFSSISTLIATMNSPINSKLTSSDKTLQCYDDPQHFWYSKSQPIVGLVSKVFKSDASNPSKCKKNNAVCCSMFRIDYIPKYKDFHVERTMYCTERKFAHNMTEPLIWTGKLDYDNPNYVSVHECCEGNLCNTINNLPKTQKILSHVISREDHDKKCPGYSDNFQTVSISENKATNAILADINNNLVITKKISMDEADPPYYKNKKPLYMGSEWVVARHNDNNKNYTLIKFDKQNTADDTSTKQNLIDSSKFFYPDPNMLHICNLNAKNGNLTISHTQRFSGEDPIKSVVNILFKSKATITPTTIYPILKCYHGNQDLDLQLKQPITPEIHKKFNKTTDCQPNHSCGSKISVSRGKMSRESRIDYDHLYVKIDVGCVELEDCNETSPLVWAGKLDYDYPYATIVNECCNGNLCNIIDNLPKIKELLSNERTLKDHDDKCPGYSDNFQTVSIIKNDAINVRIKGASGSLVISGNILDESRTLNPFIMYNNYIEAMIYRNYIGAKWSVSKFNDPSSEQDLFSFDKYGDVTVYSSKQDLIAANKLFYVTPNMLHICNLNSENGNLTISHTYKIKKIGDIKSVLNILFDAKLSSSSNSNTVIIATISIISVFIVIAVGVISYKLYKNRSKCNTTYDNFSEEKIDPESSILEEADNFPKDATDRFNLDTFDNDQEILVPSN